MLIALHQYACYEYLRLKDSLLCRLVGADRLQTTTWPSYSNSIDMREMYGSETDGCTRVSDFERVAIL